MSIELLADVSHPHRPSHRYLLRVVVGTRDEECFYGCFYCGDPKAREVFVSIERMMRIRGLFDIYPGMKSWDDVSTAYRIRIGENKPVCAMCWDEEELPRIGYLSRLV